MTLTLESLLQATLEAGGSDLHLSTGQPPLIRLRGRMVRSQADPLVEDVARDLVYSAMSEDQRRAFERGAEVDFAFELPGLARFRANVFRQRRGISAVYRVIVAKIRTLEELGTPPILRELAMRDRGLVLVTGPTGSGKSTTLAAMIDYVNENRQGHIITIEDPIEFVHESKKCLVQQREVGSHTESFAAALRSALRDLTPRSLIAIDGLSSASTKCSAEILAAMRSRLASGELGFTIPVKGRDELAETAVTFNEMSQRLSDLHKQRTKAEADIHALNALLETRVQQRTAELEATNQELEAFSYSVSHDLRAPLRAIDGFAQALAEDYTDKLDAPGLGYLARVRASAQRMGEMIDDMLALARVTRVELSVREVDMSALAREIGARLAAAHPGRVVDFAVTENLITQADVGLLRIALENLLENAWKYSSTRATARIQFGVKRNPTETVYFVRDDGVGFDMRYADKLFQPFQRLHKTTDFAGTGIGLATVARIIHRHGGRVWAEATVDQGAVFYFTLGAP